MRGSSSDGMNRGVHPAMVCTEGSLRTISTEFFSVTRDNVALQILRAVLTCAQGGAAIVARVGSSGNRNLAGLFFPYTRWAVVASLGPPNLVSRETRWAARRGDEADLHFPLCRLY